MCSANNRKAKHPDRQRDRSAPPVLIGHLVRIASNACTARRRFDDDDNASSHDRRGQNRGHTGCMKRSQIGALKALLYLVALSVCVWQPEKRDTFHAYPV